MFFLELLGIISWLRLKTPLNPMSVDQLDPTTMHSKNRKNIKKEPKVIFTTQIRIFFTTIADKGCCLILKQNICALRSERKVLWSIHQRRPAGAFFRGQHFVSPDIQKLLSSQKWMLLFLQFLLVQCYGKDAAGSVQGNK